MVVAVERNIFNEKSIIYAGLILLGLWCVFFWKGIITAFDIWIGNDIFNHCLLVIPGSFYLIYIKRHVLSSYEFRPNGWVFIFLLGCFLLYLVGLAGDVQLFMHVATFSFLPFLIWMFLGNKLSIKVLFPLFFMLFSIPFGEEFVPFLQEITADWSVVLLNLTGVPIYRSGLYIEIPQGRFLVAEACSGISFFIASVVIGSLYAYLNMQSWKRKIVFVTISILFPVIANAIRVYGIILIGYLSDMEHAVGADHLIYGWFFFAFVIICLLLIGELVREKQFASQETEATRQNTSSPIAAKQVYPIVLALGVVFVSLFAWLTIINTQLSTKSSTPIELGINAIQDNFESKPAMDWAPKFKQAQAEFYGSHNKEKLNLYLVWYAKGEGELISSLNRLYHEKNWTLESQFSFKSTQGYGLPVSVIVNHEYKRLLTHWYVIDGEIYTDKHIAKLVEIKNILLGQHTGSGLVALSLPTDQIQYPQDKKVFIEQVNLLLPTLSQSFGE